MVRAAWLVGLMVVASSCASDDGGDDGSDSQNDDDRDDDESDSDESSDDSGTCVETADRCTGETICIDGACEAAFPRIYRIRSVMVSVPTTNPNTDEGWDVGNGAPDLFLGDMTGQPMSDAVDDMYDASFAGPFDVQLVAGSTLRVDVWDEDVTSNDPAFACQADPITAQLLRARTFSCSTNGMSLESIIEPK